LSELDISKIQLIAIADFIKQHCSIDRELDIKGFLETNKRLENLITNRSLFTQEFIDGYNSEFQITPKTSGISTEDKKFAKDAIEHVDDFLDMIK
jgi:hypothetical protein